MLCIIVKHNPLIQYEISVWLILLYVIFSNADINKNNVSHQNALCGLAVYSGVLYVSNII